MRIMIDRELRNGTEAVLGGPGVHTVGRTIANIKCDLTNCSRGVWGPVSVTVSVMPLIAISEFASPSAATVPPSSIMR